ncbi:MAG: isopentenyl phosphate kinase family protein [Candidatus Micrarchaeota archaeon]|nr:isopentenyl phosphate kinase family protein [Candidatus Micrarchaeota archaeon]
MVKELIFIKIGGSVITDVTKPNSAKEWEIRRLLKEIDDARIAKGFDVIIGHGSGSFAHVVGKTYRVNEGLINDRSKIGASLTHISAQKLNAILTDIGLDMGIPLFPFTASSFSISSGTRLEAGFTQGITEVMRHGFVPVVYGDVVIDRSQGVAIASTEEVFRLLSQSITPTKVVMGTDVDGIFDKDPNVYPDAKLLREVSGTNYAEASKVAGDARKIDVSGGMQTKLSRLYEMVHRTGATGYIANASVPRVINKILSGADNEVECTVVRA